MDHRELAGNLFLEGYNCAQAVFAAFCDVTGYDKDTALRISSSFGGGMGRMREVCGALSGAFMVAGVLWGYSSLDDGEKKDHYARIQEIANRFKEKHHTILCRELLSEVKTDTSPLPSVRDEAYYRERPCLRFVEDAAAIIDEMIVQQGN
jgi:C_GCAxxG_C_C family probable redox protein